MYMRSKRKKKEKTRIPVWQMGSIIAILTIVAMVLVPMWQARPLVDYRISAEYGEEVPKRLDFRWGPEKLAFDVRNRGGTDAPIILNITVVNAYIVAMDTTEFNTTSIVRSSRLNAHTEEFRGWICSIIPVKEAPSIRIEFSIAKHWESGRDGSAITNWLFGEYNAWRVSLTYVQVSPSVYSLRE